MTWRVSFIISVSLLASVLACSRSQPTESTSETHIVAPLETVSSRDPTATIEKTAGAMPEPINGVAIADGGPYYYGLTSLEERVYYSGVVVRAKLREIRAAAVECRNGVGWRPVIQYEFEPIEFLNGESPTPLLVHEILGARGDGAGSFEVWYYESSRDAKVVATHAVGNRDGKWDDREAILFVEKVTRNDPSCAARLTILSGESPYVFALAQQLNEYAIESRYNRVWLPAAEDSTGTPTGAFLLTVPANGTESVVSELVTVRDLLEIDMRLRDALNSASNARNSGFRDCLLQKYRRERENYEAMRHGGTYPDGVPAGRVYPGVPVHRIDIPRPPVQKVVPIGFPAGQDLSKGSAPKFYGPDPELPRYWLSDQDAELFDFRFVPQKNSNIGSGVLSNRIEIFTVSGLPVGNYTFRLHEQESQFWACDYIDKHAVQDWTVIVAEVDSETNPLLSCVMDDFGEVSRSVGFRSIATKEDLPCGRYSGSWGGSRYFTFTTGEPSRLDLRGWPKCTKVEVFVYQGYGTFTDLVATASGSTNETTGLTVDITGTGQHTVEVNWGRQSSCAAIHLFLRANLTR